jgi:hypothetical protein
MADLCLVERRRVFTLPVTVWLMIMQRLNGTGTLAAAVSELLNGNGWDVLEPCKRVREGNISLNTGAFSQARMRIPVEAARRISQHTFDQLQAGMQGNAGLRDRLFLMDGTSIRLAHTAAMRKTYEVAKNQFGESHWPVMRVVVMHHVVTGLAVPPQYGPMYGTEAVGEQELVARAAGPLPVGSVLIGDRNFGVFSVGWAVTRQGHDLVVRLTRSRAGRICGNLKINADERILWEPTREDRKGHPDLPEEAQLHGRLIVIESQTEKEPLYLFTTLEETAATVAALYQERWHIETDLRSLKEQVKLHTISAKTPAMAEAELLLAVATYNIIRAVMREAAIHAGIEPRRLSYSCSQAAFWAFNRAISHGCSPEKFEYYWNLLIRGLGQCKLPNRRHRPSPPREVWHKRHAFPSRKSTSTEKTK